MVVISCFSLAWTFILVQCAVSLATPHLFLVRSYDYLREQLDTQKHTLSGWHWFGIPEYMSGRSTAIVGRIIVCLFWIVLGTIFILAGPGYVSPMAAYATGFVFIALAIVLIITMIRQRHAKFTAGWKRKDLNNRSS